jgi:hypothetical protein
MGLDELFSITPREYRFYVNQITKEYKSSPSNFSKIFFNRLPSIDPKLVRLISYQLWTIDVSMKQLIDQQSPPIFLSELDKLSEESLLILLKYEFPLLINGFYFFTPSLSNSGHWLNSLLNVLNHLRLDLNIIQKNGKTLLHEAVESGNLSLVQKLLSHRVQPNPVDSNGKTPIGSLVQTLNFSDAASYPHVYFKILKHLVSYGSKSNIHDLDLIENSRFKVQIQQNIQTGSQMNPYYYSTRSELFSLDKIEDLALIAEVNPNLINDLNFVDQLSSTNLDLLDLSIKNVRNEVLPVILNNKLKIISWPYYIDSTPEKCSPPADDRPTAESPPSFEIVYDLALQNLPDV